MRRILYSAIFILLFLSCISKDIKREVTEKGDEYFLKAAEYYLSENKYLALKKISEVKLEKEPNNYIAAYYKAFSMQKADHTKGLKFYLDFLKEHNDVPKKDRKKWFDLANNASNAKRIKFEKKGVQFKNDIYNIQMSGNVKSEIYCVPKILNNINNYLYLNENGELYRIIRSTGKIRKMNYYKTRDIYIMGDFLFFNDSINLVKFDFALNRYFPIYSFNQDKIYFRSANFGTRDLVVKHIESDEFLIKLINFKKNSIQDLPNNCISQSSNHNFIVMDYINKFEIFDIKGNDISEFVGEFLGFGPNSNTVYFYNNEYLNRYDIKKKVTEKIIYIPQYKKKKGFKTITNNKLLFCFDEYMLEISVNNNQVSLIKGELIYIFRSGYMFKKKNDERIYFFGFADNSINLLYNDSDVLKKIVFSSDDSNLFIIKKDDDLIINNLSDFFP